MGFNSASIVVWMRVLGICVIIVILNNYNRVFYDHLFIMHKINRLLQEVNDLYNSIKDSHSTAKQQDESFNVILNSFVEIYEYEYGYVSISEYNGEHNNIPKEIDRYELDLKCSEQCRKDQMGYVTIRRPNSDEEYLYPKYIIADVLRKHYKRFYP